MSAAAWSWVLRGLTVTAGTWCALRITVYRPAVERVLPDGLFAFIPWIWAGAVLAAFAARFRRRSLPAGLLRSATPVMLFALATVPTTLLQRSDVTLEWVTLAVFVAGQILVLELLLPEILSQRDYDWILSGLAAVFLSASLFLVAVNLLGISHAFGEALPLMNERGGPFRYGIVFHRNPNAFIFQWMPAVLVYVALRVPRPWRIVPIGAFAVVMCQLMLSFSRATTITVLLSLVPAARRGVRGRRRTALLVASGAVLALAAAAAASETLRKYLALGLDLNSRASLWLAHVAQLVKTGDVLWGSGYFNAWIHGWWGPHNAYLAALVYYGIPGAVLYGWIVIDAAKGLRRGADAGRGDLGVETLLALLLATLAWGLVEDGLSGALTMPAFTFWLLVGMLRRRTAECGPRAAELTRGERP